MVNNTKSFLVISLPGNRPHEALARYLNGDGDVIVSLGLNALVDVRPVAAAFDRSSLDAPRRHHDADRLTLPHHAPKVRVSLSQGTWNLDRNGSG